MTFKELCLNPPHNGYGRNNPWAVCVQTRTEKVWRFYKADNFESAHRKAANIHDCLEVRRIVPISLEQYLDGVANTKARESRAHRPRLTHLANQN